MDLIKIFTQEYSYFYSYASKITKDKLLAEDVVQEAFLKIAKNPNTEVNYPKSYICQIIYNTFVGSIKSNKVKNTKIKELHESNKSFYDAYYKQTDPSTELTNKNIVKNILNKTDNNRKFDLILRKLVLNGDNMMEIAKELNTNYNTIKSHIAINRNAGRLDWLKNLL